MKIIALVTSTKKVADDYILSTITAGGRLIVISREYVTPGSYIEVSGSAIKKDVSEIVAEKIRKLKEDEIKRTKWDIDKYIDRNCRIEKQLFIRDKILNSLVSYFEDAARKIKKAIFLHRPIIVRFHNDTDGLCSALALYFTIGSARNVKFFINTYPYYRNIDCTMDIDSINHLDAEYLNPLFIACDFGANEESIPQYKKLKKAGFEIIIIDHHPPHKDIKTIVDAFVSPYLVGGDSNYVTGLLATEVAHFIAHVDLYNLHLIALTGDRSRWALFRPSVQSNKIALAIEYLLQTSRQKYTINELAKSFLDKEFIDLLATEAREKIDSVLKRLKAKTKRKQFNNVTIFMFSTDAMFKEGEYPGRGDMASMISDELAEKINTPAITIGHGEHSINLRLNTAAIDKGFDLRYYIAKVKEALPYAIEAGGGHAGAASIRAKKGHGKRVLEQLLKEIQKSAESSPTTFSTSYD